MSLVSLQHRIELLQARRALQELKLLIGFHMMSEEEQKMVDKRFKSLLEYQTQVIVADCKASNDIYNPRLLVDLLNNVDELFK